MIGSFGINNNIRQEKLIAQPVELLVTPDSKKYFFHYLTGVVYALAFLNRKMNYEQVALGLQNIDTLIIDYYESWFTYANIPHWKQHVLLIEKDMNLASSNYKIVNWSKRSIALITFSHHRKNYLAESLNNLSNEESILLEYVADNLEVIFDCYKPFFDKLITSCLPMLRTLICSRTSANYAAPSKNNWTFIWSNLSKEFDIDNVELKILDETVFAEILCTDV